VICAFPGMWKRDVSKWHSLRFKESMSCSKRKFCLPPACTK